MPITKALCVDDVAADLINIEKIVASANIHVRTATSGAEAIEKAKSEKPGIIFLDVNMPGMDGFATTRALKKDPDTKDIPVVLVTSKGQKADKMWAKMQGAEGYVVKPYTEADILDQLKAFD